MSYGLNDDEALLVKTVKDLVDREVEHANEYPHPPTHRDRKFVT